MTGSSRRHLLKAAMAHAAASAALPSSSAECGPRANSWGTGIEGQRQADLGNGFFANPILSGDRPDPTILKDGADYYMTFSSFQFTPGAVIWHSTDLVNWTPVCAALQRPPGTVWAMDLAKHAGRYFLYIPVLRDQGTSVWVTHADDIRGPWSDPVDLELPGCIDPGHAVGEDGKRYLFVNGIRRVRLADDGLSTDGPLEAAVTPWRYPDDWEVEMFAPEGPKVFRRGSWFYMVYAVGGTSGPPTSHMVTVARSRSIHGPWEDCPHNPVVRTRSAVEPWWSRGHASLVEGPSGDWWMVYHGYENGMRTLGRQALLEPVEWTADGWFHARGGALDRPLRKPRVPGSSSRTARGDGLALSDDFSSGRLGLQWSFFNAAANESGRLRFEHGALVLKGKGSTPADCSALTCVAGDRSYEASVEMEILDDAGATQGGLCLFYSDQAFVGVSVGGGQLRTWHRNEEAAWMRQPLDARVVHLKLANRENIVTFHHSTDGRHWIRHPWRREVSGFHHNVFGGFLSLRVALFCAGGGEVRFRRFTYRALQAAAR